MLSDTTRPDNVAELELSDDEEIQMGQTSVELEALDEPHVQMIECCGCGGACNGDIVCVACILPLHDPSICDCSSHDADGKVVCLQCKEKMDNCLAEQEHQAETGADPELVAHGADNDVASEDLFGSDAENADSEIGSIRPIPMASFSRDEEVPPTPLPQVGSRISLNGRSGYVFDVSDINASVAWDVTPEMTSSPWEKILLGVKWRQAPDACDLKHISAVLRSRNQVPYGYLAGEKVSTVDGLWQLSWSYFPSPNFEFGPRGNIQSGDPVCYKTDAIVVLANDTDTVIPKESSHAYLLAWAIAMETKV